MTVEINQNTNHCILRIDGQEYEGDATQVIISTDPQRRSSVAELNGHRLLVTEPEAEALTVAGAQDRRQHLKSSVPRSTI